MKSSVKILLALGIVGLGGTAIWLLWPRPAQPADAPKPEPAVAVATPAPVVATPAATQVTLAPAPGKPDEVAGTKRMYAAHAPLRTRSAVDPDSEQNRQVLQTMVTKALSRADATKLTTNKQ